MAWRLQRSVYLFFVAVSLLLIAYAIFNGLHIEALRHQWLGQPCHGGNGFAAQYQTRCQAEINQYLNAIGSGVYLHWFAALPTAILGLLLGANAVAGEMDRNTVRTAWTQSITRSRWFTTKITVGLGSLVLLAIPLCVTVSWWLSASQWTPRISTNGFTYAGWMPLATGVFAFAVTTIVGLILRRPGWTVAVGVAVMVLVTWSVQYEVRTHLVPLRSTTIQWSAFVKGGKTVGVPSAQAPANAWIVFSGYVPVDHGNTPPTVGQETPWLNATFHCPANFAFPVRYTACLSKLDLHQVELYVADNEYWALQLREGGLYLAGAALLLGASWALVRRTRA
jgi:hypothetical protein